jgi:hypothetical protein
MARKLAISLNWEETFDLKGLIERASHAGTVAFYAARMGTFYSEQLIRFGFGDDVAKVKEAWAAGGSEAGTAAVSEKLLTELGYVGRIEDAIEPLKAQDEAGIDLHQDRSDEYNRLDYWIEVA